MADAQATIGIIGGSGLYEIDGLEEVRAISVSTPFGDPSDEIVTAKLAGQRVAFLPRHGRGHRVSPSEVNARANIFALKSIGVERIISVSAVGSLKEELAPMHLVIPDQIFDRTKARPSTFFGQGLVVHVGFAEPFCPRMNELAHAAAISAGATVHRGGTYVCIEGPQFSTKAESNVYRQLGIDIIGMTALPEAKLAREAEICYTTLAFVTDYDVWHEAEGPVTVEMVIANLLKNTALAKRILKYMVPALPKARECACGSALANAIITQREMIPEKVKRDLAPLIGRYV